MKIFLSYATEDRPLAEEIQLALTGAGHEVFFDRQSLSAGGDYHARIKAAVDAADALVFLVSPDSVADGGYALTELGYARSRWPHPKGRVLPVKVRATPFERMPPYLKSVTVLEPVGNAAAEVAAAVEQLGAVPSAPSAPPPEPPAPAGGTSSSRGGRPVWLLGGAGVLLAVAAAVFFWPESGPDDPALDRLAKLVEAANTACVSQSSSESSTKAATELALLLDKVKGEGGISAYRSKHIGADRALPPELQLPENAQIRACMERYMPGIFEVLGVKVAAEKLPQPLELRFSYQDAVAAGGVALEPTLRVSLATGPHIVNGKRLARQDAGYFSQEAPYPAANEPIVGVLTRDITHSTQAALASPARFCLRRPSPLPSFNDGYLHLDCEANAGCRLHVPSPRWLEPYACPDDTPRKVSAGGFGLIAAAHAAGAQRRWAVPSVETLIAHQDTMKGVGYTLFTIETDALREPGTIGVEVDVRVNGTPVLEDGLEAALRPVPHDPTRPLRHRFALQSLNFEGAQGGCEAIELTLHPRRAGGARGEPVGAVLSYVALRDAPAQTLRLGSGSLNWSARYVVPADEWSHEAFITSVPYSTAGGAAAAAAARQKAEALKRAFDLLGIRHQGQPVVAVIRPPLTLSGKMLAYGLTAGVVQPGGQVRFTFSPAQADAIGDLLLASRASLPAARPVISPAKYIYRVAGTRERRETPTPAGICAQGQAR